MVFIFSHSHRTGSPLTASSLNLELAKHFFSFARAVQHFILCLLVFYLPHISL